MQSQFPNEVVKREEHFVFGGQDQKGISARYMHQELLKPWY